MNRVSAEALTTGWNIARRIVVHQQIYRFNDSNKFVYIFILCAHNTTRFLNNLH